MALRPVGYVYFDAQMSQKGKGCCGCPANKPCTVQMTRELVTVREGKTGKTDEYELGAITDMSDEAGGKPGSGIRFNYKGNVVDLFGSPILAQNFRAAFQAAKADAEAAAAPPPPPEPAAEEAKAAAAAKAKAGAKAGGKKAKGGAAEPADTAEDEEDEESPHSAPSEEEEPEEEEEEGEGAGARDWVGELTELLDVANAMTRDLQNATLQRKEAMKKGLSTSTYDDNIKIILAGQEHMAADMEDLIKGAEDLLEKEPDSPDAEQLRSLIQQGKDVLANMEKQKEEALTMDVQPDVVEKVAIEEIRPIIPEPPVEVEDARTTIVESILEPSRDPRESVEPARSVPAEFSVTVSAPVVPGSAPLSEGIVDVPGSAPVSASAEMPGSAVLSLPGSFPLSPAEVQAMEEITTRELEMSAPTRPSVPGQQVAEVAGEQKPAVRTSMPPGPEKGLMMAQEPQVAPVTAIAGAVPAEDQAEEPKPRKDGELDDINQYLSPDLKEIDSNIRTIVHGFENKVKPGEIGRVLKPKNEKNWMLLEVMGKEAHWVPSWVASKGYYKVSYRHENVCKPGEIVEYLKGPLDGWLLLRNVTRRSCHAEWAPVDCLPDDAFETKPKHVQKADTFAAFHDYHDKEHGFHIRKGDEMQFVSGPINGWIYVKFITTRQRMYAPYWVLPHGLRPLDDHGHNYKQKQKGGKKSPIAGGAKLLHMIDNPTPIISSPTTTPVPAPAPQV